MKYLDSCNYSLVEISTQVFTTRQFCCCTVKFSSYCKQHQTVGRFSKGSEDTRMRRIIQLVHQKVSIVIRRSSPKLIWEAKDRQCLVLTSMEVILINLRKNIITHNGSFCIFNLSTMSHFTNLLYWLVKSLFFSSAIT